MDAIKQLKEPIPLTAKWAKNNVITIIFIAFSILKFGWLDDIEEQHYFLGDIDKIQDDFFYSIIIFEVIVLMIPIVWYIRSFNPLNYLLAMIVYAIPGVLMFYLFQQLFMALLLPINRTEVKSYQNGEYRITYIEEVEKNNEQQKILHLISNDQEYWSSGSFIVNELDTTNYILDDTITIKFKLGRFDLRFDPSNEEETLTLYKNR